MAFSVWNQLIRILSVVLIFGLLLSCSPGADTDNTEGPSPIAELKDGFFVLIGGGSEKDWNGTSWSDKLYQWIVNKAEGGKIGILSTSDQTVWLANYFRKLGAVSVEDFKINSRTVADSELIYNSLTACRVLFIKGGDQSEYYSLWKNTRTQQAIERVYKTDGIIAGTSAGAMILSKILFTAENGSLYPEDALRNPFDPDLILKNDFLAILDNVLVDTHFTQRGRIARLSVMIGRWNQENSANIIGIGIDDNTALIIDPDMKSEIIGEGSVTVIYRSDNSILEMQADQPPVFSDIQYHQMTEGYRFDLSKRQLIDEAENAEETGPFGSRGNLTGNTHYIDGVEEQDRLSGAFVLDFGGENDSLYLGTVQLLDGNAEIPSSVIVTNAFTDSKMIENRIGGAMYSLYRNPGYFSLWLDKDSDILFQDTGLALPNHRKVNRVSVMILDSNRVESVSHSVYIANPDNSSRRRQSVGLVNCRLHLISSGFAFDFVNGTIRRE